MNSQTLPRFWLLYYRLPADIRQAARIAYRQFLADPSHRSLRFHRLASDPRL